MVVLDQKLPTTKYLSYGIWIVVTDKPLAFALNRQSYEPKIADIKVAPPFGIIKLNKTCKASNKYLQLPEYVGKHSNFERSDPIEALLKLHNFSQFFIWNCFKTEFEKFRPITLPSHLSGLKEIPMQSFLCEAMAYKTVKVYDNRNNVNCTFVSVIIDVAALLIIVNVWLIVRKCSFYLTQIIGKRLANAHDLDKVNVKRTSSHGEDIEMSALTEERNVVNNSERQQNPFRRADALAAWTQCQK